MRLHSRLLLILASLLGAATTLGAQTDSSAARSIVSIDRAALRIMPLPAQFELGAGWLDLRGGMTNVRVRCADPRVARALMRFDQHLARPAERAATAPGAMLTVTCARRAGSVQRPVEDESYRLLVRSTGVTVAGQTPYGVLRGLETLLQLVERTDSTSRVPVVTIEDQPRFPWRGLMIDVARHWMPKAVILRNLDAMAAVKLNVLHLHLSDDQAFRVESRGFPRLHQAGSGGSYYSQADVREIVAYAADRGIRIVPEFDLPGHATSWLVAYPGLGSGNGPYTLARGYGIRDATLDPTREEVYTFLDRFFAEMATLFPDPYVHIGGDEVSGKTEWNTNPRVQQFIRNERLDGNRAVQAYFNRRLQTILARRGRRMIGWDEILDRSLDRRAVVQSWRGHEPLLAAVADGFEGILSAGWYLDYKLPAAELYRVDPSRPRDVVRIVPDSAHWKSWSVRVQAGEGTIDGRLTLFGPAERTTGALEIAGTTRPVDRAAVSGDTLRLTIRSEGETSVTTAVQRGDSLRGTVGMYGFPLPFVGRRVGGSDMPGTALPTIRSTPVLTVESERRILGGEAAMWAEAVSAGTVDSRIWPRTAAVAERLWSPASLANDVDDMYRRLDALSPMLTARGVTHESGYEPALRDLLGADDVTALRTLVDALEEVKQYARFGYQPQQLLDAELRSLADVARPESRVARRFAARVDQFLADSARRANLESIREQLVAWRDNDARLRPQLAKARQAEDIAALSSRLSAAAAAGLAALDAIARREAIPASDLARHRDAVRAASMSRAAVMMPAIPAIAKLLQRASGEP